MRQPGTKNMNKELFTPAAGKVGLFALILFIAGILLALPALEHIFILGDLIYGAIFMSLLFIAIYLRDASYAFEGNDRVLMKDASMGFALMLMGMVIEKFGSIFPSTLIWDLVFGALFLLGALKLMGAFGKLKDSTSFPDQKAAGTLKLAGIFFVVTGCLGILYAIPALGLIFGVLYKIFLLVAAIMFWLGWNKVKNA